MGIEQSRFSISNLLQVSPVLTNAEFNQERHFEWIHIFHVMADHRLHDFDFALRHFKN